MPIIKPEMEQYLPLIRAAWNQVKGVDDPSFNACHLDHQQTLIYKAESVLQTGTAGEDAFSIAFRALKDAPLIPEPSVSEAPVISEPELISEPQSDEPEEAPKEKPKKKK